TEEAMSRLLTVLSAMMVIGCGNTGTEAPPAPASAEEKEEEKEKDKPKPNTLTPQEITDGWILLFDGETTFGWKIDGAAEVKDGVLIIGKDKKTTAEVLADFGTDYQVTLEYQGKGT